MPSKMHRDSLRNHLHFVQTVAKLWREMRAFAADEHAEAVRSRAVKRGGIMKPGSHSSGAGFICSTLAIHKPLEQAAAAPFSHSALVTYDNLSLALCVLAAERQEEVLCLWRRVSSSAAGDTLLEQSH